MAICSTLSIGFSLAFISSLLNCISISTTRWMTSNELITQSTNDSRFGLWQSCDVIVCNSIFNGSPYVSVDKWFYSVQALSILAFICILGASICSFVYLFCPSCHLDRFILKFIICALILSFLANTSAVIIFGIKNRNNVLQFGMSFYVAAAASLFTLLSAMLLVRHMKATDHRLRGYVTV